MKQKFTARLASSLPYKLILQGMLVAVTAAFALTAKAGLVYPGGNICESGTTLLCAADLASLDGDITYTWDSGNNRGHFQFSGTPGNIQFRTDQVISNVGGSHDPYGNGLSVISYGNTAASGGEKFEFDFYLDAAGEFVSGPGGSVDMDGFVVADVIVGTGPIAAIWNGVTLDGNLVTGDVLDAGGNATSSKIEFDFTYLFYAATSLLSTAAGGLDDSLGLGSVACTRVTFSDGGDCADGNVFGRSWTAFDATANVYVPVPAAAWLFGSALLGLGALRRKA